jgi:signal transduction histidine kinase
MAMALRSGQRHRPRPGRVHQSLFTRPLFSSSTGRSGGLGLVIVQRILQLHGSDIRLQQRAEKGAVFCFALR